MSIINKMHQGLKEHHDASPILSSIPLKKQKKKGFVFLLISLLLFSSLTLSYLIYDKMSQEKNVLEVTNTERSKVPDVIKTEEDVLLTDKSRALAKTVAMQVAPPAVARDKVVVTAQANIQEKPVAVKKVAVTASPVVVVAKRSTTAISVPVSTAALTTTAIPISTTATTFSPRVATASTAVPRTTVTTSSPIATTASTAVPRTTVTTFSPVTASTTVTRTTASTSSPIVATASTTATRRTVSASSSKNKSNETQIKTPQGAHLEIKKSTITVSELASIHLKKAQKALLEGDAQLVAKERAKALNLQPQLHEVRQSLALYYYGLGDQQKALSLLKRGALTFPEYSDFNLMLSRIALKNGEQQKAFLYLQQRPPEVKGNLDYHVSYAILAQKFKSYELSESLYLGLLTQRPSNGRWRMSLAISQDKLSKQSLALENYQKALLQVDLSSKAKAYIQQRLAYLANKKG